MKESTDLKIAIVHDSIQQFGGAERVLLALHKIYPTADIYTSVIAWNRLGPFQTYIRALPIKTSFFQIFPLFRSRPYLFRYFLPLLWKTINVSSYDLVISSSGSQMSHLVKKGKHAKHVCYCHTPPRHLYGYQTDFQWKSNHIIKLICILLNKYLICINKHSIKNIDCFIANSYEVKKRIKKFYGRDSVVIYPPVVFQKKMSRSLVGGSYYLVVSRLSRMKHVDVIIRAMNHIHVQLHIVGTGPEEGYLRNIAGDTIKFLGAIDDVSLQREYRGCKALICAAEDEDFGITPLEAMSFGKPVIAYYSGGYKETVQEGKNGIFFHALTSNAIQQAFMGNFFKKIRKNSENIRDTYSNNVFKKNILKYIQLTFK